jgi:phage FluMu gp28-like protein
MASPNLPSRPKGPLLLYPYQLKWVKSEARRKIANESRGIGDLYGRGYAFNSMHDATHDEDRTWFPS